MRKKRRGKRRRSEIGRMRNKEKRREGGGRRVRTRMMTIMQVRVRMKQL